MSQENPDTLRQAELQAAALAIAQRRKSKGFALGTLIHTAGGPVPVELLRAGYMVLSRAPDAGGQALRPMAQPIAAVHVHHNTPVLRIEYECPGERGLFCHITVAPGQPLWTLAKGWIRAGEASGSWVGPSKLLTISGSAVDCDGKTFRQATGRQGIGWSRRHAPDAEGPLWDDHLNRLVEGGWTYDSDAWGGERCTPYGLRDDFRTTTYSIEVAGHHTFFAGPHGLLMGDSTIAGETTGGARRR